MYGGDDMLIYKTSKWYSASMTDVIAFDKWMIKLADQLPSVLVIPDKYSSIIKIACIEKTAQAITRMFTYYLSFTYTDSGNLIHIEGTEASVIQWNKTAKDIACTKTFSLALSTEGRLYSFYGSRNTPAFKPVEVLQLVQIDKIFANRSGYLATTRDGDVYIWGANDESQLGLGRFESVSEPKVVEYLDGRKIQDVIFSERTTFIVNGYMEVYPRLFKIRGFYDVTISV
jgi:alpha-tubulin suppressor-like RCC1 family protein